MAKDKQKESRVREINFPTEENLETLNASNLSLVKRFTSLILSQSIIDRASDFYMRKTKKETNLAYRVDGTRYDMLPPPSYLYDGLMGEIRDLVGSKDKPPTRVRVCGSGKPDNLEAYVSFVNISKSSLHLKFSYD